jgi:hypothetical protein
MVRVYFEMPAPTASFAPRSRGVVYSKPRVLIQFSQTCTNGVHTRQVIEHSTIFKTDLISEAGLVVALVRHAALAIVSPSISRPTSPSMA